MNSVDDSKRYSRATELFLACLELAEPDRLAYLERECAGEESLRLQVAGMLSLDGGVIAPTGLAALGTAMPADSFEHILTKLDVGQQLPCRMGRFTLLRRLGFGGSSVVYEASEDGLQRHIALKMLHSSVVEGRTLERFHREGDLVASLRHPGIAQVFEAGVIDSTEGPVPYLALELVRGVRLDVHAAQLDVRQRTELIAQVCDAVDVAHRAGIVHRDLKPTNILVDEQGQPRVLDFGIARLNDGERELTQTGEVMGTIAYMSPEQISGRTRIDARTDVYALGVILYEVLAGRRPHALETLSLSEVVSIVRHEEPASPASLVPALRGDLDHIVLKALCKEPAGRYVHAGELGDDLRRHLRGEVVRARRVSPATRAWRWTRRNPIKAALAGVIVLSVVLAAVAAVAFIRYQSDVVAESQRQLAEAQEARLAEASALAKERAGRIRADGLRLAARSTTVIDEDPTRALLLAIEAAERAPGAESDAALFRALAEDRELLTLERGLSDQSLHAELCADERLVVSSDGSPFLAVWDATTGVLRHHLGDYDVRLVDTDAAAGVARAVSLAAETNLHLWDLEAGRTISETTTDAALVSVAISPDGSSIAAALADGSAIELRTAELVMRHRLSGADGASHLEFVAGGTRLLCVGRDGWARLVDVATGSELRRLDLADGGHRDAPATIATTRDGAFIMTVVHGDDEGLRLWDLRTGRLLHHDRYASEAAISADRRILGVVESTAATSGAARTRIRVREIATGREIRTLEIAERHGSLTLSPDGQVAAVVAREGLAVLLFSIATGQRVGRLAGHNAPIRRVDFSPDGQHLLTASDDKSLRLWVTAPLDSWRVLPTDASDEVVLSYTPGHDVVVTSRQSDDCRLTVRHVTTSTVLHTASGTRCAAVSSASGRYLAVFASRTTEPSWTLLDLERAGSALALDSDAARGRFNRGETRLSLFDYHWPPGQPPVPVQVYRTADGTLIQELTPARDYAGVEVSPDGSMLATADRQHKTATIYDLATGSVRSHLTGLMGWGIDVAWSPDGRHLASWGISTLKVWDADTGEGLATHTGNPTAEARLTYSADGRRLLLRYDRELRLFDPLTPGPETRVVPWLTSEIVAGGFDRDASWIWAVGPGGTFRRWPVDPVALARERASRKLYTHEMIRFGVGDAADWERRSRERAFAGFDLEQLAVWSLTQARQGKYADALKACARIAEVDPTYPTRYEALLVTHLRAVAAGDTSVGGVTAALAALDGYIEHVGAIEFDASFLDPIRDDPRFAELRSRHEP